MTGREVFQSIYGGGRPDRLPVQGVGPWRETLDRWRVDTDGNAWDLIPEMLACGVTGLNPCEVASGMDVAALRARFPTLCLSGGIDKRAFVAGPRAIDLELDRCFRVAWNAGRYTPAPDHGIPPDVSWANIQHYARRYRQGTGRRPLGGCAP